MTAEEFWEKEYEEHGISLCNIIHVQCIMVAFAQYHVEKALKEASEKAYTNDTCSVWNCEGDSINKESIINAYPLDKIREI